MKSKKGLFRFLALTVAILLLSFTVLAGCGSRRPDGTTTPTNPSGPAQTNTTYDTAMVDTLEKEIADLNGISRASVVLSQDTAWVAVELDNGGAEAPLDPLNDNPDTAVNPPATTTPPVTETPVTPAPAAESNATGVGNGANVTGTGSTSMGTDLVNESIALPNGLQEEITRLVKDKVPSVNTVYVTADTQNVTDIRGIRDDLYNGRTTVDSVWDDLKDIGRRITGM